MAKATNASIDKIISSILNQNSQYKYFLIYGHDQSIISTIYKQLSERLVLDTKDPFLVKDIPSEKLSQDSSILFDEYNSLSLIGGRRLIRVKNIDANATINKDIKELLSKDNSDNYLIITAEELAASSPIRKAFESQENALSIACYVDDIAQLEKIAKDKLLEYGFEFLFHIPKIIASQFSGSRLTMLSELEKLALYKGDDKKIEEDDIRTIISGMTELSHQELANAIANRQKKQVLQLLSKHFEENIYPITIIRVLYNYFYRLYQTKLLVNSSVSIDVAISKLSPPIFFKQKDIFVNHLRNWNVKNLEEMLVNLQKLELTLKEGGFKSSNSEIMLEYFLLKN